MSKDLPYRPCVGVVLANKEGLVFTGERYDTPDAWQMPQGGIDKGETPEDAALRELEEETGVTPASVVIEAVTPDWVIYDLPDHLIGKVWKGRFRGQRQLWYLLRFTGADADIEIDRNHREFRRWRWATPDEVLEGIVPFKRNVYEQVIETFRPNLIVKK